MTAPGDDLEFVSLEDVRAQVEPRRSSMQEFGRQVERGAQRIAETVVGMPGDIIEFGKTVAGALPGAQIPPPREEMDFAQRWINDAMDMLPRSQELRARSAELFPQLEPESEAEEIADELIQDFASLAIPIKGKIPFMRAIGLSLAGNIGKQTVKSMGGSETAQDITKLGTMLFAGMFGKGRGLQNHIRNVYAEAESFVPKGASVQYPMKNLGKVEAILRKGSMNDAKRQVYSIVEEIKAKAPNGVMSVEEAIQFDKDINRAIAQSANDATQQGLLKQLKKAHSGSLEAYAAENPSFGESYNEAKQAYQGIKKSIDIQNYIKKNANLKNITHAAILLGLEESALPGRTLEKLGAVGATAATLYAGEVAKRMATNPALRRYYQNVMQASLSQNKAMLARNLAGLERAAKKEFEENPFPTFELED